MMSFMSGGMSLPARLSQLIAQAPEPPEREGSEPGSEQAPGVQASVPVQAAPCRYQGPAGQAIPSYGGVSGVSELASRREVSISFRISDTSFRRGRWGILTWALWVKNGCPGSGKTLT